ncbi:GtrA family protein [Streptomyces gobiensis]|uniref:GtrA family protein n=1 Tax=Streptomyces gobiensis TaxID=2875706 RepID=UPI001E4F7B53|nr:GtrA family protein [Streptomyces gobiensis]UGY91783.1 GtrA family protein [Streptomyces gobiensis]
MTITKGERRTLRSRLKRLAHEMGKFGTVGAFGFLVNVAVFNLCIHTLQLAPVRSGVIATAVAICTNYLGNRYWTYRHTDKSRMRREATLFLLFSGVGMVIENGVLALSHYGFGFTSPLADNIAKNIVGLGLATAFRFWSYRTWVFRSGRGEGTSRTGRTGPGSGSSAGAGRLFGLTAQEEREDRRPLLK